VPDLKTQEKTQEEGRVGCCAVELTDVVQGARVPLWLLYPAWLPEREERFGPYPLRVAMDAPVAGEGLPLVVISHGNGGSPWVYRELAAYLARAGFVVALPEHPGNSRSDNRLAGTQANLENRPRHIRLVIDAALASDRVGGRLGRGGVAVIGHSLGGYTALAVAGGRPSALPNETADGKAQPFSVVSDPRVRALVLLAPAVPWFMAEGALAELEVPILMRTAEKDELTPVFYAETLLGGIRDPQLLDHRTIPNAGHFAFLSPFPAAMVSPSFPPSQDPAGFDRAAFLPTLYGEILSFLRGALAAAPGDAVAR
jgi:predicted dienelactone hydrolase